jgi:hypothetical protein
VQPHHWVFPVKVRTRGLLAVAFLILAAQAIAQTRDDRIFPAFGNLVAVNDRSVSVRNQQGTKTFLITADTHVWRGDYVDFHHLEPGDNLSIRFRVSSRTGEATAVDIDANIDRWNGTIANVSGDRVVIDLQNEDGDLVGTKASSFSGEKRFFWWTTRQRETSGSAPIWKSSAWLKKKNKHCRCGG